MAEAQAGEQLGVSENRPQQAFIAWIGIALGANLEPHGTTIGGSEHPLIDHAVLECLPQVYHVIAQAILYDHEDL